MQEEKVLIGVFFRREETNREKEFMQRAFSREETPHPDTRRARQGQEGVVRSRAAGTFDLLTVRGLIT